MSRKFEAGLKRVLDPIMFADADGVEPASSFSLIGALKTNIRESFDELEMLRGTVQYWESRHAPSGAQERQMLAEAFRLMHSELLGLTARMRELLTQAELASTA